MNYIICITNLVILIELYKDNLYLSKILCFLVLTIIQTVLKITFTVYNYGLQITGIPI